MDTITSIQQVKPVKLNDEEQAEVVKLVLGVCEKGKKDRAKYEKIWDECYRAYNLIPDEINDKALEWETNQYLPWSRDAVDSAVAYLNQAMLPKGNQIFSLSGRTIEDHPGIEVMQKYLEHVFDQNGLAEQFGKVIKQAMVYNHPCMKVYWREDKRQTYEWQEQEVIDPATGELTVKKVKAAREVSVYNNVWFDVINLKDFVFYPVYGDFDKTTRVHETHRFLDELKAIAENGDAPYFNLDKLDEIKDESDKEGKTVEEGYRESDDKRKPQGLKIKEAWIHRIKIKDTVYHNYVATVVNDKTLVRFQPNPYEMGKTPFVFESMNPDGDCLYGDGLLYAGLDLQKYGNFIHNMRANELKAKLYPGYKYFDDDTFNPYNFINRPAGLIEVGRDGILEQLTPINPHLQHVNLAWEEVERIKIEHENVTVPKAIKGMIEQKDTTATEINTATSNASGKMHVYATRINYLLKALLEMAYLLIYQRMQYDSRIKEEIARITQPATKQVPVGQDETGNAIMREVPRSPEEMVADLPEFLPLPEVDIKVVGYENQIRKQEQLIGLKDFAAQAFAVPELAAEVDGRNMLEIGAELLTLDKDRILKDKDQIAQQQQQQADMAQQQQQMMMAEQQAKVQAETAKAQNEAAKLQLEREKMMLDVQLEREKMELEREKMALEMQKIEQADRHAQMNAAMQADQFDKTLKANKDNKKDEAA